MILFVYSNIGCSCTRKCSFELVDALKKYTEVTNIYFKDLNRESVKKYDVIILQRVGTAGNVSDFDAEEIIEIIKENKNKKKFIYMIDDLIINARDELPKRFIENCDAVMCTSVTLKKNIQLYNKNVYLFHTFIDFDMYQKIPKCKYNEFTLVWASTGGLGKDIINKIILAKDRIGSNIKLIIIGGKSEEFKNINFVETYPIISEKELIKVIKGADILLNPMTISDEIERFIRSFEYNVEDFLNCKSEIKYAIAGATQTCLLTSPKESYIKAIEDGVNGFIIKDDPEMWIEKIKYLYKNRSIKNQVAMNAYNDVKNEYTEDKVAQDVYEILNEILMS